MNIFEFTDYKALLNEMFKRMPRHGHGQARRLAEHLNINSVVVSQVLKGDKHFTIEHTIKIAKYFGFNAGQTDYLVALVSRDRAGSHELKEYYSAKIEKMRDEDLQLKGKISQSRVLPDHQKAVFYSNWYYSGVRLLTSIEGFQELNAIANYFGISPEKTREILEYLVECGLCRVENGRFRMGSTSTFVDVSSPHVNNHRRNWRLKALEKLTEPKVNDFFYSGPYSLSLKQVTRIKGELSELVGRIAREIEHAPEETLQCLNIDWFKF